MPEILSGTHLQILSVLVAELRTSAPAPGDTLNILDIGCGDGLLIDNLTDFMALPNATLEVLSRAGHEVAIHEPDRVAEAIDNFMRYGPVTAADLNDPTTDD